MGFLSRFFADRRKKQFYRDLGVPEENLEFAIEEEREQAKKGPTIETFLTAAFSAEEQRKVKVNNKKD